MATKRRAAPRPEFSIVGDEQERHRIQLEHNLQNRDLSIDLLSSQGDHSLEYARHAERSRSPFSHRSFGHHDHSVDDQSQTNPWSYRTVDDDEENGVNPYAGESLSTAAHHASAVTLNAGLGPRRGDDTRSGAEFDPERPLQNIMAGAERLSMFGNNTTSKSIPNNTPFMFDPLVIDDSAQLDMVLSTGHAPPRALNASLGSPLASSSSSSSVSDSPHQSSRRPKLSDGLRQATFSPKRPRNPQAFVSPRNERSNSTRNGISHSPGRVSFDIPTPRTKSHSKTHPQVNVQPPTPTNASSRFTKMAKGLAKEIENERERVQHWVEEDVVPTPSREKSRSKVMGRKGIVKPSPKSRVYLPDVTGLTSAVESPARVRLDYHRVNPADREIQKHIINTLGVVQSKLAYLESEHNISRRRVQELELELEQCKKDVAKERTRVLQMEMEDVERQHAATMKAYADRKGKGRAVPSSPTTEDHTRYREAVEEKKALEALVSSLRNHLTRLTSELTSHSALLAELRTLRDADTEALQAQSEEVNMLKDKVEGLVGEVEVLKGVVEEGLRERRMLREQSMATTEEGQRTASSAQAVLDAQTQQPPKEEFEESSEESEDESVEDSITASRSLLIRPSPVADKTTRTDCATVGTQSQATRPFVTDEELERISVELSERRSERSRSSSVASSVKSLPRSLTYITERPVSPFLRGSAQSAPPDLARSEHRSSPELDPRIPDPRYRVTRTAAPNPPGTTGRAPADQHTPRQDRRAGKEKAQDHAALEELENSPFPQIRGERLERLFFSAPDHNVNSCNVCNRRKRNREDRANGKRPSWLLSRFAADVKSRMPGVGVDVDDEGFAEGLEEEIIARGRKWQERDRDPPQTVLMRVVRELEDDFTHYKGIYVELSDQYKEMDAISNVVKRNVVAQHLKEVIDVLEQKGDQIASLYDLLSFQDKPVEGLAGRDNTRKPSGSVKTW